MTSQVRKDVPHLIWQLEYYHMEEKTRHKRHHRSDGSSFSEISQETEKVITSTATNDFHYSLCHDVSGNMPPFKPGLVTRVSTIYQLQITYMAKKYLLVCNLKCSCMNTLTST